PAALDIFPDLIFDCLNMALSQMSSPVLRAENCSLFSLSNTVSMLVLQCFCMTSHVFVQQKRGLRELLPTRCSTKLKASEQIWRKQISQEMLQLVFQLLTKQNGFAILLS